ncbi:glyceraldehyde-3-phosphate dehydrogenase [Vibrio sp. ER1A]|uniref:glyceraldehyde-3-phosphate dehydrogenase n=1 Tax=Vibrio sp. ER1A TaxID=1517681 RepID=UPI0004DD44C3|nr:glyceraldehyde-3-phosphate dehydrogenase [Vibrio sp. ER1A]KFA98413.1 glyceraldehyde-3-phosphate dehydrogenase [Vibrio sp. ER1A]
MQIPNRTHLFALLSLPLVFISKNTSAGMMDSFIDPTDGRLDGSQFILDNAAGFLPVPLTVTDPAVGVGGGAALLFFHESDERKAKRLAGEKVEDIPASASGLMALGTSNGSHLYGGFHSGNWRNDKIRYLGGLFGAQFNLKMYEQDTPLDLSLKGLYFFQEIDFRLGESNFFLGGAYSYMSSTSTFDQLSELALNSRDGRVGIRAMYDSRNNQFSPREGTKAGIKLDYHRKAFGGQFDYQKYNAYFLNYSRLSSQWGLGLRADVKSISDNVDPRAEVYAKPFIEMRGIAAMRYRGDNTALGEIELSYDIDNRWTILGFAGAGTAFNHDESISRSKVYYTQGAGFRYLLARQLGLRMGIDVAKGPEEWTTYIQFGSAWK